MKKIQNIVEKLLHKIYGTQNSIMTTIVTNWTEIIGKDYSQQTYPFKITSYKRKAKQENILHIRSNNSSQTSQLRYLEETIIERIALQCGNKIIHKIQFYFYH